MSFNTNQRFTGEYSDTLLEAAYQAGWQDRDLEVEWLKRILSESELHVGLLTQEVERLKEQIEDLGSDAWELEMNEEP